MLLSLTQEGVAINASVVHGRRRGGGAISNTRGLLVISYGGRGGAISNTRGCWLLVGGGGGGGCYQ